MNARTLTTVAALGLAALPAALPAAGQPVPGLVEARLLPGWVTPEGIRMTALALKLEPGWKTYWRMPGDSGIPPHFEWQGPVEARYLWPAPEVIDSGGARSFGYHDALLLPVALTGGNPAGPLAVDVTVGLCETICVPAELRLTAPAAGEAPDPAIEAALAAAPEAGAVRPDCTVTAITDGVRVAASLPHDGGEAPDAAMELLAEKGEAAEVWVSAPEVALSSGRLTATADFVPPSGKPFPLDTDALRLTLIGEGGAVEVSGCRPA